MTPILRSQRPRPRSSRSGAFFVPAIRMLLLLPVLSAGALEAQVPDTLRPPPDTAPLGPEPPDTLPRPALRDTLAQRAPVQDTAAQDTAAADSLVPPPTLPRLERPGPVGWDAGVWEWDRSALLRLPDLSLLQLLERVPGLTPVRPGILGQPESAAVLGATAGAIRYVFDGFELDPLVAPTFDPSRIGLLALQRVRVERRVTGATVYLETLTPTDPRPQSVIEAATGDFDTNLFRGTFLAPSVLGGSLGLGFERLATDAAGGANHLGGWVKWTFVRDSSGVQLELRQSDVDRVGAAVPLDGGRRDWVVRGRTRAGPVRAELYAGASSTEDQLGEVVLQEGTPQGGLRLSSALPGPVPVEATTALRFRSHPRLPRQELEVALWAAPAPWLGVGGDVVQGWWDGPLTTGRWSARARLGPLLGLTAFGGIFSGGPVLGDGSYELLSPAPGSAESLALDREGLRAGLQARWGGLVLGAAALRTEADTVPGFGLPFDSTAPRFGGGVAEGLEATARIPTLWDPLWLEGWYVGMDRPPTWLYLPRHQWRAALVYHHLPLPSGNLELYARVEHVFRGGMSAPGSSGGEAPEPAVVHVGPYRATNLELVIRVISVRAFVRWENLMHRLLQADLPGYPLPGQHISYGVKWEFWN